jgi:hypothetical protein
MNASDRAIVNWEGGDPISPVYAAKLREVQSVFNELKQLMKPEDIGMWLLTEMEEFENRTPADLITQGETGRLWSSLFYLRSGMRSEFDPNATVSRQMTNQLAPFHTRMDSSSYVRGFIAADGI